MVFVLNVILKIRKEHIDKFIYSMEVYIKVGDLDVPPSNG